MVELKLDGITGTRNGFGCWKFSRKSGGLEVKARGLKIGNSKKWGGKIEGVTLYVRARPLPAPPGQFKLEKKPLGEGVGTNKAKEDV